MGENLKPCPFCGGEGSAYQVLDYPEKIGPRFSVICNGCGASVTTIFQSEWAAIEAWNRRAERTCRPTHTREKWECDVCRCVISPGFMPEFHGVGVLRYCPNCGARVVTGDDA